VLRIFIALKNPSPWPGFEPATFGSSGHYYHQGDLLPSVYLFAYYLKSGVRAAVLMMMMVVAYWVVALFRLVGRYNVLEEHTAFIFMTLITVYLVSVLRNIYIYIYIHLIHK
jgi:hypothetical protein